jgi:acetyl-CoA acyltransferase
MKPNREVFVVGGAHSPFVGKGHPDFAKHGDPERKNPTLEEHLRRSVSDALESTGVSPGQIDKGWVGNFLGELFAKQGHLGSLLAGVHPDLGGKPFGRVEGACASGALAVVSCVEAIQAGHDVTLAAGVEVENTVRGREGVEFMARACHYELNRSLSQFTFPYLFARRAMAYVKATGAEREDLARVVVKARSNARRNPMAHLHALPEPTLADALPSEHNPFFLEEECPHREWITMADCTQFVDGASALVLASREGLERLGVDPANTTQLVSYGHATTALRTDQPPTRLVNMEAAVAEAYADAGIGPAQVNVAEVHDCFSVTELLMYEALGFAAPGEGFELIRSGDTAIDGRLPVNAGGGLLAFGHPVGATGVKQVLEVHRQIRGLSGDYQVPRELTWGLTANLGGDDHTGVVTLQRRT